MDTEDKKYQLLDNKDNIDTNSFMTDKPNNTKQKTALILSGGGARAAYQVGVLKAISEFLSDQSDNPFPIICGTSAGSINAIALASNANNFHQGVQKITHVWSNFELGHVFHVDAKHLFGRIAHWIWSHVGFGNWRKGPGSILDNSPLRKLLSNYINFERIDEALENGALHAYCLTACSYSSGESTTFFDGDASIENWTRTHREGKREKMSIDHLMASSAIPLIFESVKIGHEHFGDGSMRQASPISPAFHLGADKILIIGLKKEKDTDVVEKKHRPSLGQISGYVLDTLFLNSLQSDVERMERLNRILSENTDNQDSKFKKVEHIIINPSEDIADIANKYHHELPKCFKLALSFIGINKGNSRRFVSYLMFTKKFCSELIELGYNDALRQKDQLTGFLRPPS